VGERPEAAAVVVAEPLAVRLVAGAQPDGEPMLAAVYEVRLKITQVLEGGGTGSLEDEEIQVRLSASNAGYLGRGAELVVLLDPRRMSASQPVYWRRFVRFACVERAATTESGLATDRALWVAVGQDLCLRYGP
jgi:hypothetical protein